MSDKKLTPLQVVERYHTRYLEYEAAFNKNPFSQEDLQKKLQEVVKSELDVESEEFTNQMLDIVIEKPRKRVEVNNSALKFSLFTDFYLLTQDEELPEHIKKDYDALPIKESMKSLYSVKDGKFVENEKQEVTDNMKKYFKAISEQIKNQIV